MDFSNKLRGQIDKRVQAAKNAFRNGAKVIADDAKNLCPVKTGKLKNSIKLTETQNGEIFIVSANAKNKNGLNYAKFVEFDPRIARPFLYPAFYNNVDSIRNNVRAALDGVNNGNRAT